MSDVFDGVDDVPTDDGLVDGLPPVGSVTVEVRDVGEGVLVEIPGLGAVPNFGTKQVNEVQVAMFQQAGHTWPDSGYLLVQVPQEGTPAEVVTETFLAQGSLPPPPPPPPGDDTTGGE